MNALFRPAKVYIQSVAKNNSHNFFLFYNSNHETTTDLKLLHSIVLVLLIFVDSL